MDEMHALPLEALAYWDSACTGQLVKVRILRTAMASGTSSHRASWHGCSPGLAGAVCP